MSFHLHNFSLVPRWYECKGFSEPCTELKTVKLIVASNNFHGERDQRLKVPVSLSLTTPGSTTRSNFNNVINHIMPPGKISFRSRASLLIENSCALLGAPVQKEHLRVVQFKSHRTCLARADAPRNKFKAAGICSSCEDKPAQKP